MMLLRTSAERGHAFHGWLDSYHTFSFAGYYDPDWMGFGSLRVINEDRVEGKQGFAQHEHAHMEILTFVLEGALEHRDSLGNGSVIEPNEVQYMSAGTGIAHSEMNPGDDAAHFLQIWIEPNVYNTQPRYEKKRLHEAPSNDLELVASGDGRLQSILIRQDADLYRGRFASDTSLVFQARPQRVQWIQLISGQITVCGTTLSVGDACGLAHTSVIDIVATAGTSCLIFDLAAEFTRSHLNG